MHSSDAAFALLSANMDNSVFQAQKPLQGGRQAKAQFLPGQYFASSAKTGKSYAARNAIPVVEQVRPAIVEQRAEIEVERMGREDIANELVRDVFSLRPGKLHKATNLEIRVQFSASPPH